MTTFRLKVVDESVKSENSDGISRMIFSAILTMPVVFVLGVYTPLYICIPLYFIALIPVNWMLRKMKKDWVTEKDCSGYVEFGEAQILFSSGASPVELRDVSAIEVTGDYYRGYQMNAKIPGGHPSKDYIHNGIYTMKFFADESLLARAKLVVFDEDEFNKLTDYFEYLYSLKNIKIKEQIGASKETGLLLRHDRNYREIQILKERLGLNNN